MQFRCNRRKCLLEHGFNLSTPASLACFKAVLPTLVSWSVLYVCAEPLSGRAQPFALPEGWQTGFKFLGQRFFLWYIVDFVEGDCDEVGLNNSELPALPDSFCVPFSGFLTVV